jgi:RHS repeat-associated protein
MTQDELNRNLVFDAWNRYVLYKQGTQNLIAYAYDALGRRIFENPNSPRTLYYSSSWQVLEEDVSGAAQVQYVWSPVYMDAMVERDRDPNNSGVLSERFYVQQDANWNVTAIINTTGAVQERYAYDPYGSPTILDPSWNTRGIGSGSLFAWVYLHQGGRYDPLSGLYQFRNRDYSAILGRWIENDPLGYAAGDTNLYRYVGNAPTDMADPAGLLSIQVAGGTLSAVGNGSEFTIKFTGPTANFKVKQSMQLEVYAVYEFPSTNDQGDPCSREGEIGPFPPGYPLDPPRDPNDHPWIPDEHGHSHSTAIPVQPTPVEDHGGSQDEFSAGRYGHPDAKTWTYFDAPTTASAVWPQALALVKARWGMKKMINGEQGTLSRIRVVQRFVTWTYITQLRTADATVHWTSVADFAITDKPRLPTVDVISLEPGEQGFGETIQGGGNE